MQHFFVTPSQVKEEWIYVEGSDVNHMKNVLRMRTGEELMVSDGNNLQYRCAVERYEDPGRIAGGYRVAFEDLSVPGIAEAG